MVVSSKSPLQAESYNIIISQGWLINLKLLLFSIYFLDKQETNEDDNREYTYEEVKKKNINLFIYLRIYFIFYLKMFSQAYNLIKNKITRSFIMFIDLVASSIQSLQRHLTFLMMPHGRVAKY